MPTLSPDVVSDLAERALRVRRGTIAAIHHARSGHPGGSLSAVDLLVTLWATRLGESAPNGPRGHQFVLSKGHACAALYAVGVEWGLLEPAQLGTFRKLGSRLQGHTHVLDLPWTGASTGSLGQGFSVAIGKALGLAHLGDPGRVWCVLGDGELQEGEVWEGALAAAHHGLGALCAIVDYNKLQSDDRNDAICRLEPLAAKWEAFGWHVVEVDGHDTAALAAALDAADAEPRRPSVLIAHTVKGKGVSFMEDSPLWHGSVALRDEDTRAALEDLGVPAGEVDAWLAGRCWNDR